METHSSFVKSFPILLLEDINAMVNTVAMQTAEKEQTSIYSTLLSCQTSAKYPLQIFKYVHITQGELVLWVICSNPYIHIIPTAMQVTLLAFSGFPAPSSFPTRTPAAVPSPNGIWNSICKE